MGTVLQSCLNLLSPQPQPPQYQSPLLTIVFNNNNSLITIQDFQIQGQLGEGGFGTVFLGQLKSNILKKIIQKFAIKRVNKKKLKKQNSIQNAFNQKIVGMYDCKFIVSLVMTFQDQWYIYFILEYAQGGDTFGLIKKNSHKFIEYRNLGQFAVKFISGCVILGIQFLHINGFMYRDLKPQNVMIFQDGYVKISDFGLAKKSVEGKNNKSLLGTRFYYAPEMLLRKGYDKTVDLWALGVYLYQMSNHFAPFFSDDITPQRFQSVCKQAQSNRTWKNQKISPQLKDLINKLLKFQPSLRIGAKSWDQIKSHTFFHNFDWNLLKEGKMKSPLKNIIKKHPPDIKQYRAQQQIYSRQKAKLEGFSYYGKYAHQ